jgi:hypothetical protein
VNWRDRHKGRASRGIHSGMGSRFTLLIARPPFLPQDDLGGVTLPGASTESALPYAARGERP